MDKRTKFIAALETYNLAKNMLDALEKLETLDNHHIVTAVCNASNSIASILSHIEDMDVDTI